jgi:hypothetical protein
MPFRRFSPGRSVARNHINLQRQSLIVNEAEHLSVNSDTANSDPPLALAKFIEQIGITPCTAWRWRRLGLIKTVNLCGRHYILRSEIQRFNERAAAGEFQKTCNRPRHEPNRTPDGKE